MVQPTSNDPEGGNTATSGVRTIDKDPYSTEYLIDPYPFHEELRESGPVVWLVEAYDVWATGRYEHVRDILTHWRTFMSRAGVGIIDLRVDSWRPPSLLLEADPPDHTLVRQIIERVLSPRAVKVLRDRFSTRAETLVDRLVGGGSFDAMEELARVFPVEAFADEVGVPEEGRENLLPYGDMVFNGQGPRNEYFHAAMENAADVQNWITASCRRENLAPGGFGAQIYEAADASEITEEQAGMLVRSFLSAGLGTRDVLVAAGIEEYFEARIDGVVAEREGLKGKPAPDTFLAGAQALGVAPGEAAVFEDALAGVEAGRAGNFACVVGVDRIGQAEALRERGASIVVSDLSDLLGDR